MKNTLITVLSCLFAMGFVACEKNKVIPEGNYSLTRESSTFQYIDESVKDSYGWIIEGSTAEEWVSGVCMYKATILEKDGAILFDGYQWNSWIDLLFGDAEKKGSDIDYVVVYDEAKKSFTLTLFGENLDKK